MENPAILIPYILMLVNIGVLGSILGYAIYCGISKSCALPKQAIGATQ